MERIAFNDRWTVAVETPGHERDATPVTLPHDAMVSEARDPDCANGHATGYYPGGIYRYAKAFIAPEGWRGRAVFLEFEGVYQRSTVYLNGERVGGRPSGYAEFRVDIGRHLQIGAQNVLEVIADNSQEPNGRWYTGSGIYRPVHVLIGPPLHLSPATPRVTTAALTGSDAVVEVRVAVVNTTEAEASPTVGLTLTAPDGRVSAEEVPLRVAAGATVTTTIAHTVPDAALWSADSPSLYDAVVDLRVDGAVTDAHVLRTGIRAISVDAVHGLRVNGTPTKLRGACIHHDNGVIGAHTLAAAERRRVRVLKESGFNAIRSAHNPASRALLDACDEFGVYVMDEFTDVWTRPKSNWDYALDFAEWWERDLQAMVDKDAAHPSVIMYSIGNEIGETATADGIALGRRIADRTRELDPSRLVTNCINAFLNVVAPADEAKVQAKAARARAAGRQESNRALILPLNLMMGLMSKIMAKVLTMKIVDRRTRDAYASVDVAGYNYMSARFGMDHEQHPDRVIVGSENPPAQTVAIWHDIAERPYVIGDFAWTGWDYLGEGALAAARYNDRPRLYVPYPSLAAGTPNIDITGLRQTQSYLNEIAWGTRTDPYIAVRPLDHADDRPVESNWRSTDSVRSWSWDGLEGRTAVVEVYGGAGHVELTLGGERVGRARLSAATGHRATFSVPYAPGELIAVLRDETGAELGRDMLHSATGDLQLTLRSETPMLRADGQDLAYVWIELTDAAGIVRPLTDRPVALEVRGAASLLGYGSGEPITPEAFDATVHRTYQGRALAVLRSGTGAGVATVTATAEGCAPCTLRLPVRDPFAQPSDG